MPRLREYLGAHREQITATLGEAEGARLFEAAEQYAQAAASWHGGERRIASRALRLAFRLVDVPTWVRGVRRLSARVTGGGRELADNFIRDGIDDWAAEGHLDDAQRRRLTETLETPEATAATASLGAHLAMSVPLRFPFGSIARFMWTVAARGRAEWAALRGRSSARVARRVHTVPVALMGLVPASAPARTCWPNRCAATVRWRRSSSTGCCARCRCASTGGCTCPPSRPGLHGPPHGPSRGP